MDPTTPQAPTDPAWEALLARLGVTPEEFAQLVQGASAFPEQSGLVAPLAKMPGMRDAGRVTVAANPLEFAGSALAMSKLGSMIDELKKGRGAGMKIGATQHMDARTSQDVPGGTGGATLEEILRQVYGQE